MEKGINVSKLVCNESNIFKIQFDYDEWPANHTDESVEIRPFNGNFFHIRDYYKRVFPEENFDPIDGKDVSGVPVYKIKYSINLLPIIGEHCVVSEDDNG